MVPLRATMVAISTTAEVAMSRIERVDSDLRRWMKVGFIRESFKGFKGFKSSKGLMTTVLVVLQCKGSGKSGDGKGFSSRMYEMKNGVYEFVFITPFDKFRGRPAGYSL